jgi:hypothetical protein
VQSPIRMTDEASEGQVIFDHVTHQQDVDEFSIHEFETPATHTQPPIVSQLSDNSLVSSTCGAIGKLAGGEPEVTAIAGPAGMARGTPIVPSDLECLVLRHSVEDLST